MWLNRWLNISNTNLVSFHPYNKPNKELISLKINKQFTAEGKYIKYLRVLIASSLKIPHSQSYSEISRALGVMYKIRPFVHTIILKNLYYNLMYPHLLYAIQVLGTAFNTNLNT